MNPSVTKSISRSPPRPALLLIVLAQMLTDGAVLGPMLTQEPVVGGVTASEAKVFVRTDQAATVTLRYGSDPNLDTYLLSAVATGSPGDLTKIISLSGLTPETSYYFNVLVNGVPQQTGPPYPSFTTFALGESIAFAETLEQVAFATTNEVFATNIDAGGTDLRWTRLVPSSGGPTWPAAVVIHGGQYKSGTRGPQVVAQDLANAGFLTFAIEYRLAPPHV